VTDTSLFIAVVANQLNRITIEITHSVRTSARIADIIH